MTITYQHILCQFNLLEVQETHQVIAYAIVAVVVVENAQFSLDFVT